MNTLTHIQPEMVTWGRIADLTQRTIVWSLLGLTLYGSVTLVRGSYGIVQRHRQLKSLDTTLGDEVKSHAPLVGNFPKK